MSTQQSSPTSIKGKHFSLSQLMHLNDQLQQTAYSINNNNVQQINNIQTAIVQSNRVFLILGTMASGKTMVQYYLCQDQLIHGIEDSKKLPYIIPKHIHNNALIQKTPSTITTRVPNIRTIDRVVQVQSQQTNINKILFIQVPDIKQLKPQQQSVLILFLQRLFKQHFKIHLLLVIQQTTLCDQSQLIQSFECISGLFKINKQQTSQLISNSMSIIINKACEDSVYSDIKASVQQMNQQVIQQQSQQMYNIITEVLNNDRVYIIKNIQPNINQQKVLLNTLLEHSQFQSFTQHKVLTNYLDQILLSEQNIQRFIDKLQIRKLWQSSVNDLYKVVSFLTDPSIFTQYSQQNAQLLQQVTQMIEIQYKKGLQVSNKQQQKQEQKGQQQQKQQQQQLKGQQQQKGQTNIIVRQPLFQSGKRLSDSILIRLEQLIKTVKQLTTQQLSPYSSQQLLQQIIYISELLHLIRETLVKQILYSQKQLYNKYNESKQVINNNYTSILPMRILLNECSHIEIILNYVTNILNYNKTNTNSNINTNSTQQQQQLNIKILIIKQLLLYLNNTFINFNLQLLTTTNDNNNSKRIKSPKKNKSSIIMKNKSSSIIMKNKNKSTIRTPNPTISQLKQQFITEIHNNNNNNNKSNKHINLIDQIINLPLSHFKLHLLIQQYQLLLPLINQDNNNNNNSYYTMTIVIKQIAQILHFYHLYIQQIKFLLIIPDWNRISIKINQIYSLINPEFRYLYKSYNQKLYYRQYLDFLNTLMIYTKQKRLTKLSNQISSLIESLIYNNDDGINLPQQSNITINQNWFMSTLQQQYQQSIAQPHRPFLPIVQKAKRYQQQHKQFIDKYNQQMFMMKNRFN